MTGGEIRHLYKSRYVRQAGFFFVFCCCCCCRYHFCEPDVKLDQQQQQQRQAVRRYHSGEPDVNLDQQQQQQQQQRQAVRFDFDGKFQGRSLCELVKSEVTVLLSLTYWVAPRSVVGYCGPPQC